MLTIMIVDDEEFLHDLYREILDLKGYSVVSTALNGEEAVQRFRSMTAKPDIILMDHRMPVKNGLESMREILALDKNVQVIFLTADYSVAKQAMRDGAVGFISKPFQMDVLHNAVENVALRMERDQLDLRSAVASALASVLPATLTSLPAEQLNQAVREICDRLERIFLRRYFADEQDWTPHAVAPRLCQIINDMGGDFETEEASGERIVIAGSRIPFAEAFPSDMAPSSNMTSEMLLRCAFSRVLVATLDSSNVSMSVEAGAGGEGQRIVMGL